MRPTPTPSVELACPPGGSTVRRVKCADLVPGCDALIKGATDNEIVLQYKIHVAMRHRYWPIALHDLVAAVTSERPSGMPN